MAHTKLSDDELVESVRKNRAIRKVRRWLLLALACMYLGLCGYFVFILFRKVDTIEPGRFNADFLYGLSYGAAITMGCAIFGTLGAFCLAKFLGGFGPEDRIADLLIRYHDRLAVAPKEPEKERGRENETV